MRSSISGQWDLTAHWAPSLWTLSGAAASTEDAVANPCMQQPQLERSHFFSCAGCLCFLIPVLRLPFLQRASCCVLACWGGCTLTVDFLFRSRHIFSEAPCSWAPRDVFCLQKVSWHLWEQLPGYAVLGIWEPWLLHSALIRIDNNNWHVWSGSSQGSFTAHSSPEGDC